MPSISFVLILSLWLGQNNVVIGFQNPHAYCSAPLSALRRVKNDKNNDSLVRPPIIAERQRLDSTCLSMGVRNFIKRKIGDNFSKIKKWRKGDGSSSDDGFDDGDDDDDFDPDPADLKLPPLPDKNSETDTTDKGSAAVAKALSDTKASKKAASNVEPKRPVRMGQDPETGEIDIRKRVSRGESVQDRINRVKAGMMTEEEKQAFLRTALSGGDSLSRLPLKTGVPLDSNDDRRKRDGASPFPSDPIMRNLALGRSSDSASNLTDLQNLGSQQQKQEYLDMVTSPDRFRNLKSSGAGDADSSEDDASNNKRDDISSDEINDDDKENSDTVDSETKVKESAEKQRAQNDLGLAARLGAAAMANEKRRQKEEGIRAQRELKLEQERKEKEAKLAELQRIHNEESARREAEILQRKRQEEIAQARILSKNEDAEMQRQKELLKRQEDYWAKMVKNQRETPSSESVETPQEQLPTENAEQLEGLATRSADTTQQSDSTEQPDVIIQQPNITPKPPVEETFYQKQERQRQELERKREEQLQRLKSLNSPLPRVQKNDGSGATKKAPIRQNTFEPQFRRVDLDRQAAERAASGQKSSASDGPISSWQDLAAFKRQSDKNTAATTPSSPPPTRTTASSPPPPQRQQQTPPQQQQRKRPIRQKLDLGDDDEDEITSGSMSVSEAMKKAKVKPKDKGQQEERAKKWGIDMSRFLD